MDDVWDAVEFTEEKKSQLATVREDLLKYRTNLVSAITQFVSARNSLLEEARKLQDFVSIGIINKFDSRDVFRVFLWIRSVLQLCFTLNIA